MALKLVNHTTILHYQTLYSFQLHSDSLLFSYQTTLQVSTSVQKPVLFSYQNPYSFQLNQTPYNSPDQNLQVSIHSDTQRHSQHILSAINIIKHYNSLINSLQLSTQSDNLQFYYQTTYRSQLNQTPYILLISYLQLSTQSDNLQFSYQTLYSFHFIQILYYSPIKLLTDLNSIRHLTFSYQTPCSFHSLKHLTINTTKTYSSHHNQTLQFAYQTPCSSQHNLTIYNSPIKLLAGLNSIRNLTFSHQTPHSF